MSALDSWENFFRSCDLPSNICRIYAKSFVKERIQPFMLKELGKEELKELGITALGDQLSILRYLKSSKGILHDFDNTKSRSMVYNDNFMEHDFNSQMHDYNIGQTLKVQSLSSNRKVKRHGKVGAFFSTQTEPRRASEQSRVIRKKPVMIHDISSSSTGSMRSDAISLKTMIVNPRRNKPNFCVNFNSSNAYNQLADKPLLDDNDYNDYIELSQPKTSKIITLSNKKNSNVSSQKSRLISNINKATTSSAIRNIVLSNDNRRIKKLIPVSRNNNANNRSIQSRIQILKPKVSDNIMDRISILKH